MVDVSKRLGLPTVVIPTPSHFDEAPPWTGEPNRNYCFVEVNRRDKAKTPIRFIEFKPDVNVLLFGLDPAASHVFVGHPSVSPQHAFAAFHKVNGMCLLQDLESANGTFIDDVGVDHSKAQELFPNNRVRFGTSTHEFIFIHAPEHLRKGVPPYKPSGAPSFDAATEASVPPAGKISPTAIRSRPGESSPGGASSEAFIGPSGPSGLPPSIFPPRPGGPLPQPQLDARRDSFERHPQPLNRPGRDSYERPPGEDHGSMPRRIDDRSPRGRNEFRRGLDARSPSRPLQPMPPHQDRNHRHLPLDEPDRMGRFENGRGGHGPEGFSPRRGGPSRWRNNREVDFGERPPHDDFPRSMDRGPPDHRGDPSRFQGGGHGPEPDHERFQRGARRDDPRGGPPGLSPGRNIRGRVPDELDHREGLDRRGRNFDHWDDRNDRGRGNGRGMMRGHGREGNEYDRDNNYHRGDGYDRDDGFARNQNRGRSGSRGRGDGAPRQNWNDDNYDRPRGRHRGGHNRGRHHHE